MPRRSSKRSRKASAPNAREVASAAPRDATPTRREHAALVLVVAMILASQWLVDPRAADAFEALKRIVVRLGAVAAIVALGPEAVGAALLAPVAGAPTTTARRRARAVTALVGLVLAWGLCSACAAPHRDVALDGWRGMVFAITLAALGASRALDGKRARIALGAFWVAAAVTALASLLETAGGLALFDIRELGGRARGVALVGNEGVVALVMALAASSAAAVLVIQRESRGWLGKGAAAALLAVTIAALVGTGNLTGWLALAAGVVVVFAARLRRRLAWALLGLGLVLGLGVATVAPLRARLALTTTTLRRADWTVALTYRPIAWRAALEGVRERPLLGQGPGTFESSFVRLRLAAEQRLGRRLVKPELNAHFDAAHDEYLDAAAALGVPGALALVAVCGYLLARLVALLRPPAADPAPLPNQRDDADTALVCLAVLASAAVASSTWFPLQRLSSSVAILLVAGRAARVACGERAATTLEPHRRSRAVGVASIAVLALLALP
ncbi:MAG: O-antigen ligase family protein [bacterium]